MDAKIIIAIVVFLILIYVIMKFLYSDASKLTSTPSSATVEQTISSDALGENAYASNFTYSIWFYVSDYSYRNGSVKTILCRGATSDVAASVFSATLEASENKLNITCDPTTATVNSVPLQKWVNLLVSTYGNTMDIYLDGKLVQTQVLTSLPTIDSANAPNLYVTPDGGFSGWTSKLQYFPQATDPQTAWNIYKEGFGGSWLANLMPSYEVQVSFLQNGQQTSSYTF